jgi:chorismate mutase
MSQKGNEEDRNLAMEGREPTPEDSQFHELRKAIEHVDRTLVSLFAERVRLAREIGALKRTRGSGHLDPGQEAGVIRRAGELARGAGVPEDEVRQIFWLLIGMSRHVQVKDR